MPTLFVDTGSINRLELSGSLVMGSGSTITGTAVSINSNTSVTGSLTVVTGSAIEFQVTNTGVKIGSATTDAHSITGSLALSGGSLSVAPVFVSPSSTAQSVILVTGSMQQIQTASAQIAAVNIAPTMIFTTGSQTNTVLKVTPTFSGSSAFSGSQQNLIADFGATSVGTQFSVNDITSGSIYMVNDVSGLPILEATSDWTVNMYNYPNRIFQKTGSSVIITGAGGVLQVSTGSTSLLYVSSSGVVGISNSAPTSRLQLNFNQNSVTQNDNNGILLANATAATVGLQSVSPATVWQGNGWQISTGGSQDARFRAYTLPIQGTTNPAATWNLESSINGAAYGTALTYRSNGVLTVPIYYASSQFLAGTSAGNAPYSYRTTNTGGDITPTVFFGNPANTTAGIISIPIESNNGLVFAAANGVRPISRASINIASLTNTAGSEAGDLVFNTQTGGTAMSEKLRISGTGNVTVAGSGWFTSPNTTTATGGGQLKAGDAGTTLLGYKTTNGGSTINQLVSFGNSALAAGSQLLTWDSNQLGFPVKSSNSTFILRASIQVSGSNNTAGSEAGDLLFLTQAGGTVMTEKMRISGSGAVTITTGSLIMPQRPAFRVVGATTNAIPAGTTLSGSLTTVDYNQGGFYNNTNGIFTASLAGLYHVFLNMRTNSGATQQAIVYRNAITASFMWEATGSFNGHFGVSGILSLAANDNLRVTATVGNVQFDNNDSWGAAYIG